MWRFVPGRPGSLTGLRVLELAQCSIAPSSLGTLLLHTPRVERLLYDYLPSPSPPSISLSLSALHTALSVLQPTLRELTLRIKPGKDDPANASGSLQGALGPLSPFANLARLEASIAALYGTTPPHAAAPLATLLPPSLRRLTITDDFFQHADFAHAWLPYPLFGLVEELLKQNEEVGEEVDGEVEVDWVERFTLDVQSNTHVLRELDGWAMNEDDFVVVRHGIENAGAVIRAEFLWREEEGIWD